MKFNKPSLSHEQQLDQLIQRGLICADRAEVIHHLKNINYYRLGSYWLPFELDHDSHTFRPGSSFADVLQLYIFDRELRLLMLDAIERVEVSVRTGWANTLALRYGSHAHMDANLFKKKTNSWDYDLQSIKLKTESKNSKEKFFKHYYDKYDEPLPPLWAVVEIMTFGQLSKWYSNLLHRADRNAVAHRYGLDETNLTSFLHHLSIIRNFCAHHSRLWNREFTFTFRLPSKTPPELAVSLNHQDPRRLYNTLTMLAWLLDCISPHHHWKQRLKELLLKHAIDVYQMGFPKDWDQMKIWQESAL